MKEGVVDGRTNEVHPAVVGRTGRVSCYQSIDYLAIYTKGSQRHYSRIPDLYVSRVCEWVGRCQNERSFASHIGLLTSRRTRMAPGPPTAKET